MLRTHFTVSVCAIAWMAPLSAADTIHVPADQPTVQAGITAASPGDTVLVAPGTYAESAVSFLGKAITVISSGGPGVTTLLGDGSDSVVVFENGEGNDSLLEGFTITGGSAVLGGGVRAGSSPFSAEPTLRDCHVVDNQASESGGGLYGFGDLLVERCRFARNTAGLHGGGAQIVYGSVADSTFEQNVAGGSGGGLHLRGNNISAERIVARGNTAGDQGGGAFIQAFNVGASLIQSEIRDNTASERGGVSISGSNSSFFPASSALSGCVIQGNHATGDVGGASVYQFDAHSGTAAFVTDCVITNNTAGGDIGGLKIWGSGDGPSDVHVLRSTVANNDAALAGGIDGVAFGPPSGETALFEDSIAWGHDMPFGDTGFSPGPFAVSTSDVQGGWPGAGNLDADPAFVDAANSNYGLRSSSPCLGAASGGADLGALPYDAWTDLSRALHGSTGRPSLVGSGAPVPAGSGSLDLTGGPPSGTATLVLGATYLGAPFKTGLLVPFPTFLVPGLPLDANGALSLPFAWGGGLPTDASVWCQYWMPDAVGDAGFGASNGVSVTGP